MRESTTGTRETRGDAESSGFSKTVLDDITRGESYRAMHRDLKEVYEFYLDEPTRSRLGQMGQFSRWVHLVFWVFQKSILSLSPARRLLLLASIVLFVDGMIGQISYGALGSGFAILLFVLLLELKDKLLAQDELSTGRAVQLALMPTDNPEISGWDTWLSTRPANDVGGDLVDYLPVTGDRIGLVLGDVAGKGLGAALVMAKLQSTIRAIAPSREHLAELGAEVNGIFCRDSLPERFVSMAYLEIQPDRDEVALLNAGHLPPLRVARDHITELPKGAPAIGLMAGSRYEEQSVRLDPGDLLVIYSDGLTEARNARGEFFGRERFNMVLRHCWGRSAEYAGQALLAEVDRFVGEARPSDDLSLIVLRRTPHFEPATPEPRSTPLPDSDRRIVVVRR
jgi:hypothetical protein